MIRMTCVSDPECISMPHHICINGFVELVIRSMPTLTLRYVVRFNRAPSTLCSLKDSLLEQDERRSRVPSEFGEAAARCGKFTYTKEA